MNKLSIEHLRKMRERYLWNGVSEVTAVLDELIAIRELKGDQVPVAITDDMAIAFHAATTDSTLAQDDMEEIKAGLQAVQELFTAPQKPVEVSDSIAMQNVKDIAHCLSDIRRFVEAKFMTVGDLPSPEGLLLSGPEWKHESDAIIAALNRVADFYEQQKLVIRPRLEPCLKQVQFERDRDCEWKAAIEAAGGIVKDGE